MYVLSRLSQIALQSVLLALVVGVLIMPTVIIDHHGVEYTTALAQSNKANNYGLDTTANNVGLTPNAGSETLNAAGILGRFIQPAILLGGVFFVVLMIYAGINWMTAGGNEERITKAKSTISSAVIGLLIVLLAYTISYSIAAWLLNSESINGICIQYEPTISCGGPIDFQACPTEFGALFDSSYQSCVDACQPPVGNNDAGYFCE